MPLRAMILLLFSLMLLIGYDMTPRLFVSYYAPAPYHAAATLLILPDGDAMPRAYTMLFLPQFAPEHICTRCYDALVLMLIAR